MATCGGGRIGLTMSSTSSSRYTTQKNSKKTLTTPPSTVGFSLTEACPFARAAKRSAGCADILQMEQVDHGYHIHNIVRIRKALMPDTDFYDWPFDVSHLWDSDDENEGIFHFEL